MSDYRVEFSDAAEQDLFDSIAWGIEFWGEEQAFEWARELKTAVLLSLSNFPHGQPLAPESDVSEVDISQLIIGRYRILFAVRKKTVNILHIRGAYIRK